MENCANCNREIKDDHPRICLRNGNICMGCEFKEIDVWHLSLKGEGSYMCDKNRSVLQCEIDEDTDGNEYDLIKHKMKVQDYYSMPEFEGF